ncbi:jg21841 [Pararge aegeria aegeria]|uniref:Jg21841 protein n=1 Tax=Pararge aegeria aegeria TaxID=348720 RepID=A0A8S4QME2_9NEOP|nr:jg21841 [Pararge aegeria aegeria]
MQTKMGRACLEDFGLILFTLDLEVPRLSVSGKTEDGTQYRRLRCGSERKKQNASYVLMLFQQRDGEDCFGASQFDGGKEMV